MPKYQIEREGQTFSTFFSFFFIRQIKFLQLQPQKIDPDLDAKKNLKGASSVKKKKAKNSFPPFETKKESKGSA